MIYRTLYMYFPVLEIFGQRELPKDVAINIGVRVMRLRELFVAAEERRLQLVELHAKRDDDGVIIVGEDGFAFMRSQVEFQKAWSELLEAEIENAPVWSKQLKKDQLPEDLSGLEIEMLIVLGMLRQPEVWED